MRAIFSIDLSDCARSVLKAGTRLLSQFDWKCTASPERTITPHFSRRTTSDGCPGVDSTVTVPSPNRSVSPSSSCAFCNPLDGLNGNPRPYSHSALCTINVRNGHGANVAALHSRAPRATWQGSSCVPRLPCRLRGLPLGQGRESVGDPRLPKQVAGVAVMDQITVIGNADWHIDINARGPPH
jgi:hypothetical protein